MSNATLNFLQGANAANAATAAPESSSSPAIDTAQVLAAIKTPQVSDADSLAKALDVTVSEVSPLIDQLSEDGLLVGGEGVKLELSEVGERALRYMKLSSPR